MTQRDQALQTEAWREKTRAGLWAVREQLEAVRLCAITGELPGISRWIYDVTGEICGIFGWLGTPIANSNSKSYSREHIGNRITNSSSKEGESEPVSPEQSNKGGHSTTNTKFEEQAP